ncbi:MAG: helix-turn-helix domain-containing protein [Alcanivorax sp.]|nr:helix-turn-helix domain-containing protein [Alcanivorax sp.]
MPGFPERLKSARLRLGMTQEQLGYELNVTKASVSAWENAREAPGFRLLPKLKQVLGVSLDELLCGSAGENQSVANNQLHELTTRNEDEAALLKAFRRMPLKRRKALLEVIE